MRKTCVAVLISVLLAGCASAPQYSGGKIYNASYVGDRDSAAIQEVVAAVRCSGSERDFVNVHVVLEGIINPKEDAFSDTGNVRSILHRLSPRISSAVVSVIQRNPLVAENVSGLRVSIQEEANRVFAGEFSTWSSAGKYEVQLVVTSLYLTDGSVRRNVSERRWCGW
jgi:hypothetical protein